MRTSTLLNKTDAELTEMAYKICLIMICRNGLLKAGETYDDVESFGIEIRIGKNVVNNNEKE